MSIAKTFLAILFVAFTMPQSSAHQTTDFVLLNFTAPWCQPCNEMSSAIAQIAEQGWLIRQVDVDREKNLVQRWKVAQLPTLIVLKGGLEVDRISGKLSFSELRDRLPRLSEAMAAKTAMALPQAAVMSVGSAAISQARPVDPMLTTVRIKIEDGQSTSFGSGTIIDQHGDEALVLTCGHLFRDLNPQGQLTVDVPIDGRLVTMPATIVDFRCDETDIGLVAFRPGRPVTVAPLLPRGIALTEHEAVASFGCDHGADPTRRDSHISKLNRYIGPSNVEVASAPVQGRSGGGLFNGKSQLIGVCYAADAELDEGLYSGPEVVYQQLARLGLGRLYHPETSVGQLASNQPSPPIGLPTSHSDNPIAASPREAFPDQSMGDGWKSAISQAAQVARESATSSIASAVRTHDGSTLTAILRDSEGKEQRLTIPSPSPALLQALQSQAGPDPQMAIR